MAGCHQGARPPSLAPSTPPSTHHTSSASTSHSAPNWQMSQVDGSLVPASAEPSPPGRRRRRRRRRGRKHVSQHHFPSGLSVASVRQNDTVKIQPQMTGGTLHSIISAVIPPSSLHHLLLPSAHHPPISPLISTDSRFYFSADLLFITESDESHLFTDPESGDRSPSEEVEERGSKRQRKR